MRTLLPVRRDFFRLLPPLLMLTWALPGVAAPLPEVVGAVLQQHPDIYSSETLLSAADERIIQARSGYYPTVGLEAVASDANDEQFGAPLDRTTRRSDAFVRWNLFRGLADQQTVAAAQHEREASVADLDEAHERVALQVAQAYLDVFRLRRLVVMGDEYLAEHRRLNDDIGTRAELGRISAADVEYVRSSLIQAELQQSQLRGQLRGAEQFYRLLVGEAPQMLSEPVVASVPADLSVEQLLERVLMGNRRVLAAQERAIARGEEVGVAAGALYPSLDLEVRRTLSANIDPVPVTQTNSSTQLQLRYQLPLGGGSYSRKREAVQRKLAAQAAVDIELLRVQGEVAQLWSNWQEARIIAPRLAERVEASDRVVQAYDLQFSAARRSLADLISARGDRYRAQSDLLNNGIDQSATSIRLLSMLGHLRESLLTPEGVVQAAGK